MALNRSEKAVVIEEVTAKVAAAKTIVVAEYRGLGVVQITNLRRQARQGGVYLRVLKNSLARRAVAGTPFEGLTDKMVGPLIYGISIDPVAAAKVISAFAKDNDKLVVKAGAMHNYVMGQWRQGVGIDAVARRTAFEALGHDAGTDRAVRPYPERGSDQVRARACCRS